MTFPACSDRWPRCFVQRALPALLAALVAPLHCVAAWARRSRSSSRDIRVEGVQRTEAGTIFSYLPIKVGERVDDEKIAAGGESALRHRVLSRRAARSAGRRARRRGQERPTISSLTFVGNKEFDTDTIKKALKDIGIAEARIFDRSALDRAEQELKRQYITRGLYSANVQTTVTPQERNRVALNFTIVEGDAARSPASTSSARRRLPKSSCSPRWR